MTMAERNELMDELMQNVNGGDYGDAEKDRGDEPMYKAGSYVEMYCTCFHNATRTRKIESVEQGRDGTWRYTLVPEVPSRSKWRMVITADAIERK